jgi:hypothetical protein
MQNDSVTPFTFDVKIFDAGGFAQLVSLKGGPSVSSPGVQLLIFP